MTALVCANEARHFRIIHPFHPYRGREFELTDPQEAWVEGSLGFRDESDFPQRIPAAWTDLAVADAFTEVAADFGFGTPLALSDDGGILAAGSNPIGETAKAMSGLRLLDASRAVHGTSGGEDRQPQQP